MSHFCNHIYAKDSLTTRECPNWTHNSCIFLNSTRSFKSRLPPERPKRSVLYIVEWGQSCRFLNYKTHLSILWYLGMQVWIASSACAIQETAEFCPLKRGGQPQSCSRDFPSGGTATPHIFRGPSRHSNIKQQTHYHAGEELSSDCVSMGWSLKWTNFCMQRAILPVMFENYPPLLHLNVWGSLQITVMASQLN